MHVINKAVCIVLMQVHILKVKTAVQFLQNPKVSSSPLAQKQEFLKRKGLTDEEIKTAFKLASVDSTVDRNVFQNQNPYTAIQMPQGSIYSYHQRSTIYPLTLLEKVKEFFNVTALIGVTVYCAYWLYKVFYGMHKISLKNFY